MYILLWYPLVAANVVELDQGRVEDLRSKQSRLFLFAQTFQDSCFVVNVEHLFPSAFLNLIPGKV